MQDAPTTSTAPAPQAPPAPTPLQRRNLLAWLGLAGPIFTREVRSAGRRTSTYVVRFLYVGLMLGLVTLVYFAATADLRDSSSINTAAATWDGSAAALQQSQIIAPSLALAIIWLQFIVLSLLSPSLTGGSICDERQKGTLATLLCTPLNVRQIILGKLAGSTVQIGVLALASLPVLLSIRVFGGVRADTILWAVAVTMSQAILGAALGLLFSISSKRAAGAMSLSVFLLIALNAQPLALLIASLGTRGTGFLGSLWDFSLAASPFFTMFRLTGDLVGEGFPVLSTWPIWATCLINLGLAALTCTAATLRLRRLMLKVGAGTAEIAKPSGRNKRKKPALATPLPAAHTLSNPDIPAPPPVQDHATERETTREVGDAPIAWRELRQPLFPSRTQKILGSLAIAAVILLSYFVTGNDINVSYASAVIRGLAEQAPHIVLIMVFAVITLFVAMTQSTGGISGERDARTWEVLITSPLSARQIILGKWLGGIKRSLAVPLLLALYLFLLGTIAPRLVGDEGFSFAALPLFLLILVPPVCFLSATGLFMSLLCRRSVHAAVLNGVLGLSLWLVLPLTVTLLNEVFRAFRSGTWIDSLAWGWNPIVLLGFTLGELWNQSFFTASYSGGPFRGSINSLELVIIISATALAYVLATVGTLALCIRGFHRLAPRVS